MIVVTPFMHDNNGMPRNFATLAPSELPAPCTGSYTNKILPLILQHWAGVSLIPPARYDTVLRTTFDFKETGKRNLQQLVLG